MANDPNDPLLADLRRLAGEVDDVPDEVTGYARAALDWRRIDAELAELLSDSRLDPVSAATRSVEGGSSRSHVQGGRAGDRSRNLRGTPGRHARTARSCRRGDDRGATRRRHDWPQPPRPTRSGASGSSWPTVGESGSSSGPSRLLARSRQAGSTSDLQGRGRGSRSLSRTKSTNPCRRRFPEKNNVASPPSRSHLGRRIRTPVDDSQLRKLAHTNTHSPSASATRRGKQAERSVGDPHLRRWSPLSTAPLNGFIGARPEMRESMVV